MLRGLPGSNLFLAALAGMAAFFFAVAYLLLRWRTRPA
jgi:hypothetical protein